MAKIILIVEDNIDLQTLYKSELEKASFSVLQAFTGQEGLQKTFQNKPDLILLDVMLPGGMNGFDVLTKIRSDKDLQKIPVIMMTNLQGEEKTAASLGATDYFFKADITTAELVKRVQKRLRLFSL